MNGVEKLIDIICSEWDIHPDRIASQEDKRALIQIASDLDALYQNKDVVRVWLDEKVGDLAGMSPRAAIACGNVQCVAQYVVHISGR